MAYTTPPPTPGYPPPKKRRTNAIIIGAAAAAIAAIVTAGIIVANSRDDSGSTAEDTTSADTSNVTAAEEPEPTPEDTGPEVYGLTDAVAYEDGIKVALSDYKRGVSSAYAAPESTPYVSFTVKVVNGSESMLDLGTGFVLCYYGDESREGEQIFDEGLHGMPSMRLRPGRTATARVACEVPKGESYLQVEMAPSVEAEVAIFAGDVK